MSSIQVLSLMLALSVALNIAIATGLLAHRTGAGTAHAILAGAGAAATGLGLYFAAITAYG